MGNPFGRSTIIPATNKSGGSVVAGDIVIFDSANDLSFTTTTTGAYTGPIGVAQQSIANNAVGLVLVEGYAALVNVNASVTRLHYGKTYTVAKQATDAGTSRIAGTFCAFLKSGTTPDALIWQPDLGAASGELVSASTIWDTKGDLAVATAADTASKLAAGANDLALYTDSSQATGLIWKYPKLSYVEATLAGDVTMTTAGTWYDGPSVSLVAGTWLVTCNCEFQPVTVNTQAFYARLMEAGGPTYYDERLMSSPTSSSSGEFAVPLAAIVVLGSPTTVKMQGTSARNGDKIIRDMLANSQSTHTGTHMIAVRLV